MTTFPPDNDEHDLFAESPHLPSPSPSDRGGEERHNEQVFETASEEIESVDDEPVAATGEENGASFEDLTLAEVIGRFFRSPGPTARALTEVARTPAEASLTVSAPGIVGARPRLPKRGVQSADSVEQASEEDAFESRVGRRELAQLGLRLLAFLIAFAGSKILADTPGRTETNALAAGLPWLVFGALVWLAGDAFLSTPNLIEWLSKRSEGGAEKASPDEAERENEGGAIFSVTRMTMVGVGTLFSILAWIFTANNLWTTTGFISWLVSIAAWTWALAPAGWNPILILLRIPYRSHTMKLRRNWTLLVLLLLLLMGAAFRLTDLAGTPPEMTSDHVEKLLDANRTMHGQPQVFFPNNGGREGTQMYLMALMSQVPGLGMNFVTLKLLSAIEGLAAILAMFWMGREIVGEDDRRLGNLVGLALAALVAASYWHVVLSRLGLRIVLTTFITPIVLLFLARALRHNRRGDYIKAGLALGFGLYMYQAVRILPVVILAGFAIAFVFKARGKRLAYLLNLGVLIVIAFVVFLPLFEFSVQYPDDFWRRTQGRLLGDDVIQTTDASGNIVERTATLQERLDAFNNNLPVLMSNIRNALLMFNWKGDVAWINAAPNFPEMDVFAGTLLILGGAAWLARMIRKRDSVDWLMPLALVIMLLPSALSIAYPIENPSATRASGSLPIVYLLAALPLALVFRSTVRVIGGRGGVVVGAALALIVVSGSYSENTATYFGPYHNAYQLSSLPYSEAGTVLRGFADMEGGYGNAFMIAYPYWWDHRAIGLEAGITDWPNGIVKLQDVPQFLYLALMRTDQYRLDPDKDLLFFYNSADDATQTQLQAWFPTGYWEKRQSYQPEDTYNLFYVPRLGSAGFAQFLQVSGVTQ